MRTVLCFLFRSSCTVAFFFVFAFSPSLGILSMAHFILESLCFCRKKTWTWCGGGVTCVVFCVDGRSLCCLNSCKSWLSGLVQTLHHLHPLRIRDILFCIVAMSCCHPPYAAFKVIEEVSTGERSIVEWWEVPCRNGCSCRRARCPFWHSKSSSWYKVVAFSHEESLIISLRQGHVTLACSLWRGGYLNSDLRCERSFCFGEESAKTMKCELLSHCWCGGLMFACGMSCEFCIRACSLTRACFFLFLPTQPLILIFCRWRRRWWWRWRYPKFLLWLVSGKMDAGGIMWLRLM